MDVSSHAHANFVGGTCLITKLSWFLTASKTILKDAVRFGIYKIAIIFETVTTSRPSLQKTHAP